MPTEWLIAASQLCVAAGLVSAVVVLVTTGRAGLALNCALDLWLAAGLLGLSAGGGWQPLVVAALVIVVRHLAGGPLHRRGRAPAPVRR